MGSGRPLALKATASGAAPEIGVAVRDPAMCEAEVKTHAAPACELSPAPPTMAVVPSADSATEAPWRAAPTAPLPKSFDPCWVQTPPLWVKTHAAPVFDLSSGPPTIAVVPSP